MESGKTIPSRIIFAVSPTVDPAPKLVAKKVRSNTSVPNFLSAIAYNETLLTLRLQATPTTSIAIKYAIIEFKYKALKLAEVLNLYTENQKIS